jgi:hypothetical protein
MESEGEMGGVEEPRSTPRSTGRKGGGRKGRRRQVGPACQRPQGKEKEERGGGPLREKNRSAVGRLGQKGEEVRFFSFVFQTQLKPNFYTQIHSKLFQTFSQHFVNSLIITQATKTMHSQIMMHKHLLSLN